MIFYNERQNGVVYPDGYQLSTMYTELCEVIVKGILFVLYHMSFSQRLLFKIGMETIVIFFSDLYTLKKSCTINDKTI